MRRAATILIGLSLLLCGGCAVFNRNNTPALNYVDEHLVPKDRTARALSYPIVVPIGLVAATADMLIIHPISVAEDAWHDTNDLLWKDLDWDERYVTTTLLNAPRVAAMPVIFTADLLARSSFDISRRGGDVRLMKETQRERPKKSAPSF